MNASLLVLPRLRIIGKSTQYRQLAIAVVICAVALLMPDTAQAMRAEEWPDWAELCAACVGFAIGGGIFALPALIAFLLTPAGELALAGCGAACINAFN